MEKQLLEKRIAEKFPDEKYTILYYGENSYDNTILKCLCCGRRITVNTSELLRKRRKHICSKCCYKRQDTIKNEEIINERLKNKADNVRFFMEDSKGIRHHMVEYKCKKCNRINIARVANFLRYKYDCVFCEGKKEGKDTDLYIDELKEKFGNNFSLCSEYINAITPIKIRCNKCGFIREVKPSSFLSSGYCPHCGDKGSKGEKVIFNYLTNNNIDFITQKYFSEWNIGIHYFDFFIPKFNLVIEYHGRQHYEFNEHFHKTLEEFEYRKNKDNIKKQTALQNSYNYVSISYKCFSDLNKILNKLFNSTTIPVGSRGKCLEIETIQDLDKDIV